RRRRVDDDGGEVRGRERGAALRGRQGAIVGVPAGQAGPVYPIHAASGVARSAVPASSTTITRALPYIELRWRRITRSSFGKREVLSVFVMWVSSCAVVVAAGVPGLDGYKCAKGLREAVGQSDRQLVERQTLHDVQIAEVPRDAVQVRPAIGR